MPLGALGRTVHHHQPMPNGSRDYYEVLGVTREATPDELKQAYRKLAVKFHPDRNPDDPTTAESFKAVSEAYHTLSDPDRRAHYDRYGKAPSTTGGSPRLRRHDGHVRDRVGRSAQQPRRHRRIQRSWRWSAPRREQDLRVEVEVSLVEAAKGVEKTVEFTRAAGCERCGGRGAEPGTPTDPCPACAGRGEVRYQQGPFRLARPCGKCEGRGTIPRSVCSKCTGNGVVRKPERLAVTIPAGVEDGATRSVRGYGDVSRASGVAGNLELLIKIAQHPLFTREGADLHCTVPVSFPHACLGAVIEVPTLEGKVNASASRHATRPPAPLALEGNAALGGYGAGDQIVTISSKCPPTHRRATRAHREVRHHDGRRSASAAKDVPREAQGTVRLVLPV